MKAAVTVGKRMLELRELAVPELDHEEALLQVKYTGICGTDTHIYEGSFPLLNYPISPGHEFVGRLVDINTRSPQLKVFKPGDLVVAQPFFSCYACDTCAAGGDNYCNSIQVLGVHRNGSMAEYVKVPAKKLVRLGDGAELKLAALTEPLAVGVHGITKGGFAIGNTAFVIGAGVIGVMIAIAARLAGASKVLLCDINDHRLGFARALGFDAMDSREADFSARLTECTKGLGFDVVFEATGSAFGVKTMTTAAKRGGIIVQVGISTEHHPLHIRSFSDKEIQVRGVRIHAFQDFKTALGILESGREKEVFGKIITDVFPLENAAAAMRFQAEDAKHFKVLVENENF